jgi:uncharacterized membrane protein HdeD (DUF308 family)
MAGTGSTSLVSASNVALGLAATIGMVIAVFFTIRTALLVFGIWALLSGAIQLVTAVPRPDHRRYSRPCRRRGPV